MKSRRLRFILQHVTRTAWEATGLQRVRNRVIQRGRRNAVFIHIPKTAGLSLVDELGICQCRTVGELRRTAPHVGRLSVGHMHYPTLVAHGWVPKEFDDSAFKFAFVRNSWDRMVSLYHYLSGKPWAMDRRVAFETFLHLVRDHVFEDPGCFNHRGLSQAASQLAWIRDSVGREITDYIGRFETIDSDKVFIARELGCALPGTSRHLNASKRGRYQDYYTSHLRNLVESVYGEEIERFKFTFN